MATINGREGRVVVYSTTSTGDVDHTSNPNNEIVGELISYSIEQSINLIDTTILKDEWTTNTDGVKSWSGSFESFFDIADTTGQALLTIGSKVFLDILPEGQAVTSVGLQGFGRINSISYSADNSTLVKASFSATGTGEFVTGAVGTIPVITSTTISENGDIVGTISRTLQANENLYVTIDGTTYVDTSADIDVVSTDWTLLGTSTALTADTYECVAYVSNSVTGYKNYDSATITVT